MGSISYDGAPVGGARGPGGNQGRLLPEGYHGAARQLTPLITCAGVIELVTGLLVSIGLWTSYAAFLASGQMAVAYFMAHAPEGFFPIVNKGEQAVLYCFIFLFMASRGSGVMSVDGLIGAKDRS